ncbi:MAG: Tfp pilus assembly protein FimT/FimU [Candidatus Methylacidiphilales bacterium]
MKNSRSAFTLTELLVVITIITIMTSFGMVSYQSLTKSRNLTLGGNLVVDLVNQARQNSISRNVMTALVMVNNSPNQEWNNRLFVLLELRQNDTEWKYASMWHMLPTGVLVEPFASENFTSSPSALLAISTPSLKFGGTTLASEAYVYQVFLSDGRLLGDKIPKLHLVQGTMSNGAIQYTSAQQGSTPLNYYEITLNNCTGIPKIDRP